MSKINSVEDLYKIINDRIRLKPKGSYVVSLVSSGKLQMSKKVGEEAMELLIEVARDKINRQRVIEESSDLIFHLYVLLASLNISSKDIMIELNSRHNKKKKRK